MEFVSPLLLPCCDSAQGTESLVPTGVMAWPQLSNFLSPACPFWLAWLWRWCLGTEQLCMGHLCPTSLGPLSLSLCLSPALSAPQPQMPAAQQDTVPGLLGASTDPLERERSTGSSRVAASLELLLPALTHTFIRINEACNKRIREAKKAAETEAEAGSRQEGHEGVCGSVRLARAAQEQHTSLGTCPQLPTWTHSSAHICSSQCTQA